MFGTLTREGCPVEDLPSDFLHRYLQRGGLTPLLRFAVIEELRLRADEAAGCDGPPDADAFAEWLALRIEDEITRVSDEHKHNDRTEMEGLVQARTTLEVGAVLSG